MNEMQARSMKMNSRPVDVRIKSISPIKMEQTTYETNYEKSSENISVSMWNYWKLSTLDARRIYLLHCKCSLSLDQ